MSSCEAHSGSGLTPPGWSSSACMLGRPPYAVPAVMRAGVGVLEGARPPAFRPLAWSRARRLSTGAGPACTPEGMRLQASVPDLSTRRQTAAAWMFPRLDRAMLYPMSAALRRRRSVCPRRIGPFGDWRRAACLSALWHLSKHRDGETVRASEKRVRWGLTSAPRARLRKRFSRSYWSKARRRNLETAWGRLSPPGSTGGLFGFPSMQSRGWSLGARSRGVT